MLLVSWLHSWDDNISCGYSDLQLDVKGCKDVYASFDKYVEVERLEGDNKYHAEQHGLQVDYHFFSLKAKFFFEASTFVP